MVELLGYAGSLCFILATLAQALKSIRQGHSRGISHWLLWILTVGYTCMITYVLIDIGWDEVLLSSYFLQFALWAIIAKYLYFPRVKE